MSAPVSPDARRIWRTARTPVFIVLIVVLAGVVLALGRAGEGRALDPRSYSPEGARALTRLLEDRGVRVEPVYAADDIDSGAESSAAANATVLVAKPDLVRAGVLARLAREADVVLVEPGRRTLAAMPEGPEVAGPLSTAVRGPGCVLPAARAAGSVRLGGTAYRATLTCYDGGLAREDGVAVLGGDGPLTNAELADEGNAALTMRLLGERERLVWYLPTAGDPGLRDGEASLYELLPRGWVFGTITAGIAVVLLALWRARRLGRVVTEPLPVVVRAAETVEGRARLYRRAGASDHAAEALRHAGRSRLLPLLGLAADAEPSAVVASVAARTRRSQGEVGALLYGPPPADDAGLVRLADALDALESEVR